MCIKNKPIFSLHCHCYFVLMEYFNQKRTYRFAKVLLVDAIEKCSIECLISGIIKKKLIEYRLIYLGQVKSVEPEEKNIHVLVG